MARAHPVTEQHPSLYERDFYLWVEEQTGLLRRGALDRLDVANLVEEIEDLGIGAKKAVKSNLVVVLLHLLKHQFQPRRRSRSWRASIVEHRQRLRDDLRTSPSLRGYARDVFVDAYADARARAGRDRAARDGLFQKPHPTRWSRPSTRSFSRTESASA